MKTPKQPTIKKVPAARMTGKDYAQLSDLQAYLKTQQPETDQKVKNAAKFIIQGLTASKIARHYFNISVGEIKNQQGFEKKHQHLYKILTDLNKAHTKAFYEIQKELKLHGIEAEFEGDVEKVFEEFDKVSDY